MKNLKIRKCSFHSHDNHNHIKTEEDYMSLLRSGMFFEFHPRLSGSWQEYRNVIEKACAPNLNHNNLSQNRQNKCQI